MGDIMWNCFKAGCNARGAVSVNMTAEQIIDRMSDGPTLDPPPFELPHYVMSSYPYSLRFKAKYNLHESIEILWDVKDQRYVFPIYLDGNLVDATGRSENGKTPKWLRYGDSGVPYRAGDIDERTAVVVEDCISAAVIGSDFMNLVGVALLGTSMGEMHKEVLSRYDHVIIALDPDALPKTIQMAKELRNHVRLVTVMQLKDDIKYRHEDDMEELTKWNLL